MKMYIARDMNKELFAYYNEPKKMDQCYVGAQCAILARNLFPEVTFEKSPMEVELVIKK
jgi:hypothetical protein